MSSSDGFKVVLPSNFESNLMNKPYQYETTLAKQLDLFCEWDVALIDIAYLHNCTNLVKAYQFCFLKPKFTEIIADIKNICACSV